MGLIKLTKEQKMIQTEFRKFAVSEIEPLAEEIEKKGVFPQAIVDKLAELGLLGLIIPEKYGGVELDMTSLCIAVEEISRVCASLGTILVVNNCLVAYPLMHYGGDSFKNKYLNKLAAGEIGGFICQPEIDLLEEQNDLKIEGDSIIFSGRREVVLNGSSAGFFILPLRWEDQVRYYLLESGKKGITMLPKSLLGLRAAGFSSAHFSETILNDEDCFSSTGKMGKMNIQHVANIGFAAVSLGIAQAAMEAAVKYSKERIQFEHRICEYPMVREMLAEMKLKIETARLLVYDAAFAFDAGEEYSIIAGIARLTAAETGFFCALNGIQVHGGYGYMKDYPLERFFRDAKVLQFLETSPGLVKSQIAAELLK